MRLPSFLCRCDDQSAHRKERRFLLDLMFSFLIIALLLGIASDRISSTFEKAQLTTAMESVRDGRIAVIEYRALTGDWLDDSMPGKESSLSEPDSTEPSKFAEAKIERIQQGAIHIGVRNLKRGSPRPHTDLWSFRPAIMSNDAPTLLWICGSRQPPAGFHASGKDLTTLSRTENYQICR